MTTTSNKSLFKTIRQSNLPLRTTKFANCVPFALAISDLPSYRRHSQPFAAASENALASSTRGFREQFLAGELLHVRLPSIFPEVSPTRVGPINAPRSSSPVRKRTPLRYSRRFDQRNGIETSRRDRNATEWG